MDKSSLVLAGLVLLPVVLLMVLRVQAVLVFLSLCLGIVLVQYVAPDADQFMNLFAGGNHNLTQNTVRLLLLLLPVVLTTVFMIRTVRQGPRLLLNLLPALGVGLLLPLIIVPLLPSGLAGGIESSVLWHSLSKAQTLIVGAIALVCLLSIWAARPKGEHAEKHGRHHK